MIKRFRFIVLSPIIWVTLGSVFGVDYQQFIQNMPVLEQWEKDMLVEKTTIKEKESCVIPIPEGYIDTVHGDTFEVVEIVITYCPQNTTEANEYFVKRVISHEVGHYLHYTRRPDITTTEQKEQFANTVADLIMKIQ